jgi:purine nucleosidase
MRNFLIDTDTASDDAVAIMMALAAPDVRVLGLTTVAGNVGLEQATSNALLTAKICNADVPVFIGATLAKTPPGIIAIGPPFTSR